MDTLLDTVISRALGSDAKTAPGVRLHQRGMLRLQPGKPWLHFRAEQVIRSNDSSFCWDARVRMVPLVTVRIVDAYERGHGRLDVRLWRLIRLAAASGPEIDAAELLRYMAELPWCPYAYRDNPELTIQAVDESNLAVSVAPPGRGTAMRLTFDRAGDVVGAFAEARPRLVGDEFVSCPWSGAYSDHEDFGEARLPRRAVVSWHLDDGPFECFRGEILDWRPLA